MSTNASPFAAFVQLSAPGVGARPPTVTTPLHGTCAGCAISRLIPDLPISLTVPCLMAAVPGPTIDYRWVCQYLRHKCEELGIEVTSIQFDRWRIKDLKVAADEVGFGQYADWSEVGQGYKDFSPRVESFETALMQGRIRHGMHPLLSMSASNAIVIRDPANNKKLDKSKSTLRIDPIVAAVMASYPLIDGKMESFDVHAMIA